MKCAPIASKSKSKRKKEITGEQADKTKVLVNKLHERHLQTICKRNTLFPKGPKIRSVTKKKSSTFGLCVSHKARKAYLEWKKQNQFKKEATPYPEVQVQNLLWIIQYLNSAKDKKSDNYVEMCLKKQHSQFETFWDSPSYILKLLNNCVLIRDWSNMTHLLLILLNYHRKYVDNVRHMCQIMLKFNPLVKQCGLEDQFKSLFEACEEELVIV